MIISIDTEQLESHYLTLGAVLLGLAEAYDIDLQKEAEDLVKLGEADTVLMGGNCGVALRNIIKDRINALICDSAQLSSYTDESLLNLAGELKKIYPEGKKVTETGSWYWTEGKSLIVRRLKGFFRKYGEYPAEEIIDATRRYIEDTEGDPKRRTLRNFIFKEDRKNGTVESYSDLLTWMENKGETTVSNEDRFVTLR